MHSDKFKCQVPSISRDSIVLALGDVQDVAQYGGVGACEVDCLFGRLVFVQYSSARDKRD